MDKAHGPISVYMELELNKYLLAIIQIITNASSAHTSFRPAQVSRVVVWVCWFGTVAVVGSTCPTHRHIQKFRGTDSFSPGGTHCPWHNRRVHCGTTHKLRSTLHCFEIFKIFFLPFFSGQEFSTAGQKSFELTGFQNTLSGMYSPVVFSGSGADLTEAYLFCHLACDRDSCCDGFLLTQVQGGNVAYSPWYQRCGQWRGGGVPREKVQGDKIAQDKARSLGSTCRRGRASLEKAEGRPRSRVLPGKRVERAGDHRSRPQF